MIDKHLSHYLIEAELGRGGMGIVYRARDTKLDRTVAIKVLPSAALASEDDRARFYREAKAAAALTHPHIAIIHAVDEAVPEGAPHGTEPSPFIAMEFIDGETLEQRIAKGPIKLEEAVRIATAVASGLEAAHKKNIVHRDIKSANVIMDEDGNAKILDFGLAQTAQSTRLTRLGSTLGTAAYMSPEQARGEQVDARADLWSLGIVLYEMITARVPFAGEYEQAVIYGILNEDPAPMTSIRAGVPMSLDWIAGKLLAKRPDERYQSASELLIDLKTADLSQEGLTRTSTLSRTSMSGMGAAREASTATDKSVKSDTPAKLARKYLPYVLLLVGIALGVGLASKLGRDDKPPAVRYVHRNFESLRTSAWPAISESGRYLAVSGRDSVDTQALLRVVDLQTNTTVTIPNSADAEWPAFSLDESRIAFVSYKRLKIAHLNGNEPLDVSTSASEQFIWARDGSIYFTTPSVQLMVVRSDGTVEPFAPADSIITGVYPAALLSDEKTMLVGANADGGKFSEYSLDMRTGERKLILDDGAFISRYTNSGHLIAQASANGQLVAFPFSADELAISGLAQPIKLVVSPSDWFVSGSGHFVSYSSETSSSREMVEVDASGLFPLLIDEDMDFEEFQLSPSGDELVAEVNGFRGGTDQILLFDLIAKTWRQITFDGVYFEPTWSPKGDRIALASENGGAQNIAIKSVNGSNELVWITDNAGFSGRPDWSPTGAFIAFDEATGSSDSDILMYSLADGSIQAIVDDPGNQQYARFSPDGRFIAYESEEGRMTEVFVINVETGEKTPVTQDGGFRPTWGPDGTKIYYAVSGTLFEVDVTIKDRFAVLGQPRVTSNIGDSFYFDVSAQGRIAAARKISGRSTTLEIIQNWSSSLEK